MEIVPEGLDLPVRGGWHFTLYSEPSPDPAFDELVYADSPAEPVLELVGPVMSGIATRYGTRFSGRSLGCGTGVYRSDNPQIIAVGPARSREWGCGTLLQVCGKAGCLTGVRVDGCPGCGPNHLDLSESGIALVCGDMADYCRVQIQRVESR
ncbi:MAG TPA: hypothetical protein VJB57_07760 [Dehalococcoidia bacterium]|nr:hypothetical protein [Dehalococcoidia bacterium]